MQSAYYSNSIKEFLNDNNQKILGFLANNHQHSLEDQQKNAWISQIQILKEVLTKCPEGQIYFEFSIPRMGKRVDNILIINGVIFVLEFKVNSNIYGKYAIDQTIDYCLDLKNFHEGSHSKPIVPVLVSTNADHFLFDNLNWNSNQISNCLFANQYNFKNTINKVLSECDFSKINVAEWEKSIYKPTPTIVEAAQVLYSGHNVQEISRSDASAKNLSITSNCIQEIIKESKSNKAKSIIFVTGVPGAGKTLAGLNIATSSMNNEKDEHAVFLSGNGPLVDVLREALARDESESLGISKSIAASKVKTFIQNIHHFRDDGIKSDQAPVEKVVIFDEAQRAWTKEQASKFMQRKKGINNFNISEPECLIDVMNRHKDWCTIICLIGGGQEINTGEAGLIEWFNSLKRSFPDWNVFYSEQILEREYTPNIDINKYLPNKCILKQELHLATCIRSFRSEKLSDFVHSVINNEPNKALELYSQINSKYPIFITRNLDFAKNWIKNKAQGSQRYGIITSSNAVRLKPDGINIKVKIKTAEWFLNGKDDIRSSYFLEDVATEFDIQGLELDWTIVGWDANLRYNGNDWEYYNFSGTKWQNIRQEEKKRYLLNSYRVLLTRARQGMIIYIPKGCNEDITRKPEYYSGIYKYFLNCGLIDLDKSNFVSNKPAIIFE